MKTNNFNAKIVTAMIGMLIGVSSTALAADETTPKRDEYVPLFTRTPTMQLKEVPEPVRITIEKEAAGRKVADIDRETWSGRTVYEVEFAQPGRNGQIHVAEDGTIVKPETTGKVDRALNRIFMGTQLQDTPAAVQETIKREAGNQQIVDIDKERRTGQIIYEVEIRQPSAKNVELHIAEDGTVVRDSRTVRVRDRQQQADDYIPLFPRSQTIQLSDVPEPARKTVEQQAAGRQIADIDRETWSGRTVYEVEFAQPGRNGQIHVAEDGTIVKSETTGKVGTPSNRMFLGTQVQDTPPAVQGTIKREAGNLEIVDIDKESRTGQTIYEVEIRQSGAKNVELHIAEDGTIVQDSRRKSEKP